MAFVTKFLTQVFGNKSERDIKGILPVLERVKSEFERVTGFTNDELRAETEKLKARIKEYIKAEEDEIASLKEQAESGSVPLEESEKLYDRVDKLEEVIDTKIEEVLNEVLPTAFAIVKDTARRFAENEQLEVTANDFDRDLAAAKDYVDMKGDKAVYSNHWEAGGSDQRWNMIHYDVQLIGGIVLHEGKIAEMATGEGKTLVATLPVFLNALADRGVHLVTVNDYLARRDSEWMGPIFEFHGLSVDCIDKHQPNSAERRAAYNAHITYGTNNEFGFDYLRDNMAINPSDLVQRKHHYAIVDEVDSVLIDDARTPLIISGPIPKGDDQLFEELKSPIERLVKLQRDLVAQILAEAKRKIKSEDSKERDEGALLLYRAFKGLPKNKAIIRYLSEEGIKAKMQKSENYYMQDNSKNMHVVTDPLYFVIDEKLNSIELTDKGIDVLSQDNEDPNFFILPDIGAEIAEIENDQSLEDQAKLEKKDELIQSYAVKSERVHTINQLLRAYTMFEKDVEYVVMDNKVKIVDEQTGRIMEGRRYSDGLHQAIEAKERVTVEAATQTFATITLQNYFRMYHKLAGMTGTAETEAGELWDIYKLEVVVIPTNKPIVRKDQEDLVYKTKKEKYNAIIEEITNLHKQGRPVLVGTTSVEISELLSRMLKMRGIDHQVLNAKLHQREADIVAEAGKPGTVTIATNMAGRGTDIKLTPETKDAGGLAIIGTERHESRRVDRQLRGRSGRQGDPGSSQFFVSLEDDLMRLFSSDRIAGIMDRLGLEEGEVIQHSMISKSIERAQKKVEENNFGIRKRLLEYDDVMNSQREVIYKKRKHALFGERLEVDVLNMMYDSVEALVADFHPMGQEGYEEFRLETMRLLSIDTSVTKEEFISQNPEEITDRIYKAMIDNYSRKVQIISKQAWPVIKDVYEHKSHIYNNIVVPISDGQKVYQIVTNLEKSYKTEAQDLVKSYTKQVNLASIDDEWKEHLRELDDLRTSVQNASYEQKDPLLIYKLESFNLFKSMMDKLNRNVVSTLMKGHIPISDPNQVQEAQAVQHTDRSQYQEEKSEAGGMSSGGGQGGEQQPQKKMEPVRHGPKIGRNDPCPCGSGKKYKQCHGRGVV
ncbi:preprotein translocase subunit SecA [Prolixibacter denitrificans]|uniref:Protein translocase subunit SecA n=1 Tax=Prolixibacter denitrificans TaxID=1541063 RepID=A0A2P8C6L9_9BACT|nr:preprotein translocase subunit SecA [Prolixibacter denitrificans]PSK80618.1 preprotein translocase subunit SecA [Prolixibacter denitrificans]GET22087.1 protein translocase subunit SecA [Prolixibacter denitrificans]